MRGCAAAAVAQDHERDEHGADDAVTFGHDGLALFVAEEFEHVVGRDLGPAVRQAIDDVALQN